MSVREILAWFKQSNPNPVLVTGSDGTTAVTVKVDGTGVLAVSAYAILSDGWSYAAANLGIVNTTVAVTFKAAAGAGIRNYITGITITSEALTNATELAIRDGAAGTVLWRIKIGTGGMTGGMAKSFTRPLRGSANTLLEIVTLTASGAGAVYFNANGFVAA